MSQTIVIIGAGPAGLLLAHYLLRRGHYRIELYERRADPRWQNASSDRTFPISLQERGRRALRAIPGLETAIAAQSTFCQGTVIHRKPGNARRIPRKNAILSVDRNRLVAVLLEQLLQADTDQRVHVQFDCQCIQIEGTAKTVTVQPATGEPFNVHYDVLVGADGARSRIREYLVETGAIGCEQEYIADAYKSIFLSRQNQVTGFELEPNKIHTWNLDNKTRLILVSQPGDRLSGTLIFEAQHNPLTPLTTAEATLAFFQTHFPEVGQLITLAEAEAFLQRPVARVLTVKCDRFHQGDSMVLLGDAAHAVSPSIGQGCNASLEDVWILNQLLDQHGDQWDVVLPAFSQQRVPDAHALRALSDYSFPRNRWLVFEFFLRLTVGRQLHKWFPQWVKPFVFDLILDTDLSYAQVLDMSRGWINKVERSMPRKANKAI